MLKSGCTHAFPCPSVFLNNNQRSPPYRSALRRRAATTPAAISPSCSRAAWARGSTAAGLGRCVLFRTKAMVGNQSVYQPPSLAGMCCHCGAIALTTVTRLLARRFVRCFSTSRTQPLCLWRAAETTMLICCGDRSSAWRRE